MIRMAFDLHRACVATDDIDFDRIIQRDAAARQIGRDISSRVQQIAQSGGSEVLHRFAAVVRSAIER